MSDKRICAAPGCTADLDALGKRSSAKTCSPACRQAAKRSRAVVADDRQGDLFRCSAPHGVYTTRRRASANARRTGTRTPYGSSIYRAREVPVPVRCDRGLAHGGPHGAYLGSGGAGACYDGDGRRLPDGRINWTDAECAPDPDDVSGRRVRARLLAHVEGLEALPVAAWRLVIDAHRRTVRDDPSGAYAGKEMGTTARWLEERGVLVARPQRFGWFLPDRWLEGCVEPEPERPSAADVAALVNAKHGAGTVATGAELEELERAEDLSGRCAWCGGAPVVSELSPVDVRTWHKACNACELLGTSLRARHLHGAEPRVVDPKTRQREREAARLELEGLTPHQQAGLLMVRRWRDESERPRHRRACGPQVVGRKGTRARLEALELLEELPGGGLWRLTPRGEDLARELRAVWLAADEDHPIHAALAKLPLPPSGPEPGTVEHRRELLAGWLDGVTEDRLPDGDRYRAVYSGTNEGRIRTTLEEAGELAAELEQRHPRWTFTARRVGLHVGTDGRVMAKPRDPHGERTRRNPGPDVPPVLIQESAVVLELLSPPQRECLEAAMVWTEQVAAGARRPLDADGRVVLTKGELEPDGARIRLEALELIERTQGSYPGESTIRRGFTLTGLGRRVAHLARSSSRTSSKPQPPAGKSSEWTAGWWYALAGGSLEGRAPSPDYRDGFRAAIAEARAK